MTACPPLPPIAPLSGERYLLTGEYKGYRSCLGLLRLGRRHGEARLEAACARALAVGARSYRHVDSILKHGLERLPLTAPTVPSPPPPVHEHLRGPAYYQDPEAAAADRGVPASMISAP